MSNNNEKTIKVYNKKGKLMSYCNKTTAWVLIKRRKALKISEDAIKLILTKQDIRKIRNKVIKRDNSTCYYCGKKLSKDEITIDHKNPKSINSKEKNYKGYDTEDNYVCCCKECNSHKKNTPFKEYIFYRLSVVIAYYNFLRKKHINLNRKVS